MKQFAVIGLGRFGSSVARTLAKMGYEVLALDNSEERVNDIIEDVTHGIQIDALDEHALKAVGIRNFDVVVVAIGQDVQASILATVILKEMGVKYVVAKAQNKLHGKVLQRIGADKVVFPERDMGVKLAHALVSKNVMEQISLSADYSLVEMLAPAQFVNKTLAQSEARNRYGVSILAIRRGDQMIISPGANQVIQSGDVLVVIGKTEKLQLFETVEI
ncbi:potassium channel family protein [Desulforamulus hydrothermalis]|uniref:Ktr system potassium uptake protein C n=1 Tax=Desulforamulus hydrothermalis Lam5 = DSM 18033 TaxID=1121428 RepID=K8EET9_9FIRM|nr:TrkA family potassium uptake protein [Desulforamulus hydrothermalis]CCO07266.1 Ktr system potassium uptake protein C [Desulforamulus hydrothermalis Lam5 = DSM 18033]SHG92695.1 trk system potassium uptake protein TrkA [Desulforamulus hydrothermalis Lam5 = DSM 18033]